MTRLALGGQWSSAACMATRDGTEGSGLRWRAIASREHELALVVRELIMERRSWDEQHFGALYGGSARGPQRPGPWLRPVLVLRRVFPVPGKQVVAVMALVWVEWRAAATRSARLAMVMAAARAAL